MNMLVAGVGLAGDALFDTVCAGGVNMAGWTGNQRSSTPCWVLS